ncbi:MAG: tetratricopeptide repeat protein, partial [Myxococcales bacterium]|nr:tetratricopeptide repeat protein [Myxococcales bacterium]
MNEIKQRLLTSRNWLGLIEELEAEVEQVSDRQQKSKRLYALGQACEELFLRKDKAMVNYQKAFKLFPQDVRPLVRARNIYREMGNLKMVAKLMDFQLKVVVEPSDRIDLLSEIGRVYVDLGDIDKARARIQEAQQLDASGSNEGIADVVSTIDYDKDEWPEVVNNLIDEVAAATDAAAASLLLLRAARIYGIEAPDDSTREDLLRKAVEFDPTNIEANFLLESLLADSGRQSEIVELQEARAANVDDTERARMYRDFASQWAIRFVDMPTTARFYDFALRSYYNGNADHFPGHLAAYNLLREVRGPQGAWAELLELADSGLRAPLLEEDQVVLATQAAEIAWREVGDVERAAGYYAWIQRIDPDNASLQEFLAEHPGAIASAAAEPAAAPADDEAAYHEDEATRVSLDGEMDGLIEASAHETVEGDTGTHVALDDDAAARAEAEAQEQAEAEAAAQAEAEEAAQAEAEEAARLAAEEEAAEEARAAEEAAAQAEAEAREQAEQEEEEEEQEEEAAHDEEEDERDEQETAASDEEEEEEEEEQQQEAAAEAAEDEDEDDDEDAEPAVAAAPVEIPMDIDEDVDDELRAQFAEAVQAEADGPEAAIDAWRRIATRNRKVRTPKRQLARLYEQVGRYKELVDTLKDEVDLVEDVGEQVALLRRMAELYRDELRLDVMVVNTLSQVLKIDPGQTSVLDDLALQYETMNRWTDLISTLKKKAKATANVEEKIEIWSRIAALFVDRFSNQAEAIKGYERVMELDPTNRQAIENLKGMYERRRDWEKLIEVSQREIELLDDDEDRAARFLEVAQLASSKLKRPQVSMDLWQRVLDFDSNNLQALEELEKLYERAKEWDKLAEVCERQVELMDDAGRQSQVLQKLGLLFSDKAQDDARAIEAWKKLLDIDPSHRRAQDSLKKLYLANRDYDALETFYASQDKWDEFIRVLERQVDSEEPETRLRLYFKIANLWQQKMDKADRAVRSYEKVLALDETNLQAAEALIPLYEGGRDVKKYVSVLEIQLSHTDEPDTKLERLRHLADLYENRLRDKDGAFERYLAAFEVDCRAEWIREEAERLAGEADKWPELVNAYEAGYDRLADPIDLLPLMLTVARVYEEQLGNVESALETNTRILELEPQNAQAIDALERLYTKTEQWNELLEIYQRKIELVDDPDERKQIYFRIAYLYEEEVGDADKAIDAYRTVLDLGGDDPEALRALESIYQRQERWSDLADTLVRQLSLVADDTQQLVDAKFRLGQLRETHNDDIGGAIDCYRDILDLAPEHDGARGALENYLQSEEHQIEVCTILEPIYTNLEDWHNLINVHEIQLSRQDDPLNKVELLLRIGNLWVERVADGSQAFNAYSRCFKVEPTNEIARTELERLAAIQDRWEDLAVLYEEATQQALDAPLQHELLIKLAGIFDERTDQSERAIEFYRRAQELEPDDTTTLDALEKLYTRGQQWNELIDIYRRKAELSTDADERLALYTRMAMIWEEMLGNLPEAISCYNEVLAQDDANMDALRSLDRLYQVQGAWHELADNLTRQLALADESTDSIELLVRVARLRETELNELAAAVDTYRQVLEQDPTNASAVEALERLISNEEHQQQVAQILEPYYKSTNNWHNLIGVYEIMVKHAYDPVRKIELLHQIGELYELAGDDASSAFAVYGRALKEDPAHEETQSRLWRLARQLDGWGELVQLYNTLVADVMDEMLAVQLHMKVATIFEEQVGDLGEAAEAYKRILALNQGNIEAINALESIYIRSEQHVELVGVLLSKAEVILEADERKSLFFRAAQIYEDVLEQLDDAIKVYQQVLELDDTDTHAIESLERLYTRLERWEDLKDVFVRKVELADEPDAKKSIYYALGTVYETQLEDLERAIETFQSVLDLDPEDLTAIRSLDRLYQQSSRWYDLLQVLERQVELAGHSHEGIDLKHRIGRLWENELGDLTRAVETYREVLSLMPTHDATLAALDAIVHGENEPVLAAQVLEPVYEQSLEWAKLIDLYEVMVRNVDDPFRKIELLHRIANLQETREENSAAAFEAYGRALQEDSADEQALAHLERLASEIGGETGAEGWQTLAKLYESELDKLVDAMRQVEMGLRVARVYEEELGDAESAIRHFNQVLEVEMENRDAILALDRLYQQGERYGDLAEILRRRIRMAETEQDIIDLQFRLGQLYQEALEDLSNAIECYREILASTPEHTPSVTALELLFEDGQQQLEIAEILEPLYRMGEQWEKLVKIMQVQLERMDEDADKVSAIQRIAEICEQRLGDHHRAFQWWGYALAQDPLSEMITDELERLARTVDGWSDLAGYYGAVLEKVENDDRKRLLKMMARVFDEELRDAARAEESYLYVLQLDDIDPDALAALDRIYDASAMYQELAEILKRRIAITDDTEALIELQLRLGQVYETALEDLDSATKTYNSVLDTDSRNSKALDALEQIYFRREQWRELYDTYEKLVDIAPGDAGVADCYARMAKISSDALEDPENAQDLWNRVLDLRGEDPIALWALADLYEAAEEWRELVEVLQRQVHITEDGMQQIRLYQRLGRIWGDKLGRDRNALESWMKVLEIDPGNTDALYAMAAIYRNTQAWEELVETLQRLIDIGMTGDMSEDELKTLYTQLGELEGEILLRPQAAIDAWRKVLDLQPDDFRALGALELLLTQEARWEECIQVLQRKVEVLSSDEERIDVLMQAANIWQEKVGDADSASRVYERIMELDNANRTAFEALDSIYREGWHWEKLIDLLLGRTDHADSIDECVTLLQQVAKVYEEQLNMGEQAFVVLQAAFKQDYTNDITAKELERLASSTNKWNELLTEYNTVVQTITDPEVKSDLLVKMGRWYGNELGHLDYAIASVQQALQIDPESVKALTELGNLYRKTARWAELGGVLQRNAELEDEPDRKTELYLSLAELFETQLQDPNQAIAAYNKALAVDENNADALNSLERLYRVHQQWEALIQILSRKAENTIEPELLIPLKQQIGQLFDQQLGNSSAAIDAYKDILTIEPQSLIALRALEALYEKTGQTEDYLDVLEQQLDVSGSDDERVSLYQRMAGVWEEQFNKLDRAAECLEKILIIDERNESTYRSLERLYKQDNRFEDLVDVLRRHINATNDPHQRVEIYMEMGQVYEKSLTDPDRAIEAYNDILSFDPDHTHALDALARLYEDIGAWDRAVDVMTRLTELVDDANYRVNVFYRLGRIYEEQLHDTETAEERYMQALEVSPSHAESMVQLIDIYKIRGDWAKAAQLMIRAEQHTQNALEKSRLLHEAGAAYMDQLGDEATAAELFARTLEIDPDHVDAGEPLAHIYFRDGRFAEVEPVLDMLVRKADRRDNRRLQDLYYKLGTASDKLGKNDKALKYYRAAYDIDSTHLPTLLGMADLLHRMEDWDRAFKIYQTILVHHRDSQRQEDIVDIFYRLGNIKLKLGERKKALNMFEK